LLLLAKHALMSQGANPDPTKMVGVEDKNTLRASLAAKIASAEAATPDITINFDLVNGATSNERCGDSISIDNIVYESTTTPTLAKDPVESQSTVSNACCYLPHNQKS